MAAPIGSVTIVGGGTAGWLTALLLSTYLAPKSARDAPTIRLIESPTVATIGVGEATVPAMPRTLRLAGIAESRFFRDCNASFKLGVRFDNWNVDQRGDPVDYTNPFSRGVTIGGVSVAEYFVRYGAGGLSYSEVISYCDDLARAHKGPRPLGAKPFDQSVGFAYHLDAGRFAAMLQDVCTQRGVRHILDDVVDVERDQHGYIAALDLNEGGRHPVELVIDCTGFRGMIINEVLEEPFVSYSRYLANDRALAVQLPHPDPNKLEPLTRSTALGAGWVWRVPLYNRVGTGYVFSSDHRTDEEARAEFLAHLGPAGEGAEPRVIPMRIGRTRNPWVKNCVAVGLSAGFIEPLESTAIHMTEMAVRNLLTYFPDSDYAEPLRERYNAVANRLYDEIRDFICLHYALSNRTDSQYWIDAREALELPDRLAGNIELWRHKLPTHDDIGHYSLFSRDTYVAVLLGKRVYQMDGFARSNTRAGVHTDPDQWRDYLRKARAHVSEIVARSADHRALLDGLRGASPARVAAAARKTPPVARPTVPLPGQSAPLTAPIRPAAGPRPTRADSTTDDGRNLL